MPSPGNAALVSGTSAERMQAKWDLSTCYQVFLYLALCFVCLDALPNNLWDPELRQITLLIGILGLWRYCWWLTHHIRSEIYARAVYPKMRARAAAVWDSGWRPPRIHFMMTTLKERRDTTHRVIQSICDELRRTGLSGTLWLGSGEPYDEDIITNFLAEHAGDVDLEVNIVRQNVSGKRMAIGLVLRAMSRRRINKDDLAIFMDGDAILSPNLIKRCAPLFAQDPELQAITTDEKVICFGPIWVQHWLSLRFAQRRVAMQSHALSEKVLTLTGRMSMFRASHLTTEKFIRILETDHLEHWLWGNFRFLSGDDKSTWFYLLTQDAKMLYVPDALIYTIEQVSGSGLERMTQNFGRWSGNMLRNGTRAIRLGPNKVGFFIWWCLVDQRIAMWTVLIGPIVALNTSLLLRPSFIVSYLIWVAMSRLMLCLILYRHSDEIHISWPFILYFSQLFGACVKVYCLFRLSKQRWLNRGNQTAGISSGAKQVLRNSMANYVTAIYISGLVFCVVVFSHLIQPLSSFSAAMLFVGNTP